MLGLTRKNGGTAVARPLSREIARWDPWSEFDQLRREMDRFFGGTFGPAPRWAEEIGVLSPPVDLYETAEEVVLSTRLPGISREEIQVEVVGDTIHISGETKRAIPEKDVTVHQEQSSYGKFDARYTLPVEVKPEACKATYRDGLLEIRIPKAESAKPKAVPVKIEG